MISPFAGVFYPVATLPALDAPDRAHAAALVRVRGAAAIVADGTFQPGRLSSAVRSPPSTSWPRPGSSRGVHRHAVRTGLIARYSAETIT